MTKIEVSVKDNIVFLDYRIRRNIFFKEVMSTFYSVYETYVGFRTLRTLQNLCPIDRAKEFKYHIPLAVFSRLRTIRDENLLIRSWIAAKWEHCKERHGLPVNNFWKITEERGGEDERHNFKKD